MPSLSKANARFQTELELVEGGSGTIKAVVAEPNQGEVPSYQFNLPRRKLRVPKTHPLPAGALLRGDTGIMYVVASHGVSEGSDYRSHVLYQLDINVKWEKRGKSVDPVTKLEVDTGLKLERMIWGSYEALNENFDRLVRTQFESGRFITNAPVALDDVVDGRKVSRADHVMGIYILTLG